MGILGWLISAAQDPWSVVKAWRQRRAEMVDHPQEPTFHVYQSQPDPEPGIAVFVTGRDIRGRLLREMVDLDGYSLHQLNLRKSWRREFVWERLLEAELRLVMRFDAARKEKR